MDPKVFRSFLKKLIIGTNLEDQLVLLLNGRILQYNTYQLYKSIDCMMHCRRHSHRQGLSRCFWQGL
jgi:hypothetical protein